MSTLWIGQDYLIRHSVIDDNTEYDKITPVIELVQDKYILPLLGTSLYNTIETHILAYINSATTIPTAYKTLIDNYILKRYLSVPFLFYNIFISMKISLNSILTEAVIDNLNLSKIDRAILKSFHLLRSEKNYSRSGAEFNLTVADKILKVDEMLNTGDYQKLYSVYKFYEKYGNFLFNNHLHICHFFKFWCSYFHIQLIH